MLATEVQAARPHAWRPTSVEWLCRAPPQQHAQPGAPEVWL